ncbi:MAG: type II/IV secretion system protein [Firmicutes bacterium]|nr:type II/IV secretion system protein [Bacillota bacterium]
MPKKTEIMKEFPMLDFLRKHEFITKQELIEIEELLKTGEELESVLLRYMMRDKLLLVKGLYYNDRYGSIDLLEVQDQLNDELIGLIPREQMLSYGIVILRMEDNKISVAMENPNDNSAIKLVEKVTGAKVTDKSLTLFKDIRQVLNQNRLVARYLYTQGVLPEEDYRKILDLVSDNITELENVLLRFISREELLQVKSLVNNNKFKYVDLFEIKDGLRDEFTNLITREVIHRHRVIILYEKENQIAVAMDDPCDFDVVEMIEEETGGDVTTRYITLIGDIEATLRYVDEKKRKKKEEVAKEEKVEAVKKEKAPSLKLPSKADYEMPLAFDVMDLTKFTLGGETIGGARPIVETIVKQALIRGASDIHIEPGKDKFPKVRYRIDGILTGDNRIDEILEGAMEPKLHEKLISIIKVLSGESGKNMRLDVTDKPQDGRIYIPNVDLDLRIIILPSFMGESVVIRILRREMGELALDKLGFEQAVYERFRDVIELPYGMILVSGPTGAGKSTTQYAVLKLINSPGKKVLTIEDPVEYSIPGAVQNQVNPFSGFTFDVALRAFVRSDPDVIMVGEIRDVATASIAMESALTGHMVISSIHARDAISTVTRLQDMGVDTRLITATCTATLAQRLVRRTCPHCREQYSFSTKLYQAMEQHFVEYDPDKLFKGKGCQKCYFTGYSGRIGIYELLEMSHDIKNLFLEDGTSQQILKTAREQQGMRTLLEDALHKCARGITTEEEVWRVTLLETESWKGHENKKK